MSEWRTAKLGELIDIFDSKRVPLSSRERANRKGVYPYYGAQGVIDYIDDYIFDGRFILIPEDGENLRSRKLPIAYFAEGKFWVNNHAHIVKAKPGVANDRFVQGALESTDIGAWVTGAAQPKLSQANLREIPLPVPGLRAQEGIAAILDAFDDLIENNRRRIELLESMARAIYREWFVHFRFPGHEDVELVDSALGSIPEGWSLSRIGDVLELKYGKALKAGDRRGGDIAVVGSSGIVGWHDSKLIDGPAVVVGRKGNVGNIVWVPDDAWPIDTTFYVDTALPLRFVSEQLRTIEFLNSHAAVPGLSRDMAYARPFLQPPDHILDSYESAVSPLFDTVDVLSSESEQLAVIRDLLLPKLVTGQIDVSGLDVDGVINEAVA